MKKEKLHSEEYFVPSRDFWWNRDFLELMAKRWDLKEVHHVLDAGCGVGHWGRALAPLLPKKAQVIGIDREAEWVKRAQAEAQVHAHTANMFSYQQADLEALPFANHTFDMVTCQTVLIHMRDPQTVIRELIRVLRPGGLLAVAEPNNSAASLVFDSLSFHSPVEEILAAVKFQLISERGKAALGLGHNSVGDLLPGYFATAGLKGIQTYLSDKACALFAPYGSPEQRAVTQEMLARSEADFLIWDKEESKRYFLAGGGSEEEFQKLWHSATQQGKDAYRAAVKNGTFHTAGGGMVYLVSGRKETTHGTK